MDPSKESHKASREVTTSINESESLKEKINGTIQPRVAIENVISNVLNRSLSLESIDENQLMKESAEETSTVNRSRPRSRITLLNNLNQSARKSCYQKDLIRLRNKVKKVEKRRSFSMVYHPTNQK